LGGGFVGLSDDATALFWNPAGMGATNGVSAAAGYMSMFAGISHSYAAVTFPVGESFTAGVSAVSLSSGDIEVTDLFTQKGTGGYYSATDLAIGASISGQLTDQFSFGATGKVVSMGIADVSASGVAFDFGTMYDPGFLGLKLGFAVQNLSAPLQYSGPDLVQRGRADQVTGQREPDVELETNSVSLPLTFRAGIASEFLQDLDDHELIANTEFNTTSNAPEHLAVGLEYTWKRLISARAGYQIGSPDAFGLSGGIGFTYQSGPFDAALDYGIRPHSTMGLLNTITATVRLR
jgi:hypothetical protein